MLQFRRKSMMRDVEIDWIRPLGMGLWQTQFRTIDYLPDTPTPDINLWRAVMRLRFVKFKGRSHDDALKNPFSFLITSFSLSYLGAPSASGTLSVHIKTDYQRIVLQINQNPGHAGFL